MTGRLDSDELVPALTGGDHACPTSRPCPWCDEDEPAPRSAS